MHRLEIPAALVLSHAVNQMTPGSAYFERYLTVLKPMREVRALDTYTRRRCESGAPSLR